MKRHCSILLGSQLAVIVSRWLGSGGIEATIGDSGQPGEVAGAPLSWRAVPTFVGWEQSS